MAQPQVLQYDDALTITASDSTDDPAGPFAGLYCMTAGTVKVTTYAGTVVSVAMVAGGYLYVPVRRVWSAGTSGTYLGLRAATQRQGT